MIHTTTWLWIGMAFLWVLAGLIISGVLAAGISGDADSTLDDGKDLAVFLTAIAWPLVIVMFLGYLCWLFHKFIRKTVVEMGKDAT